MRWMVWILVGVFLVVPSVFSAESRSIELESFSVQPEVISTASTVSQASIEVLTTARFPGFTGKLHTLSQVEILDASASAIGVLAQYDLVKETAVPAGELVQIAYSVGWEIANTSVADGAYTLQFGQIYFKQDVHGHDYAELAQPILSKLVSLARVYGVDLEGTKVDLDQKQNGTITVSVVFPQNLDDYEADLLAGLQAEIAAAQTAIAVLPAGRYTATIKGQLIDEQVGQIEVDSTAPVFTFFEPQPGSTNASALYVDIGFDADVDPLTLDLSLQIAGQTYSDLQTLLTINSNNMQGYIPAYVWQNAEGTVLLHIEGQDQAGNLGDAQQTIVYDITPPTAAPLYPAADSVLTDSVIIFGVQLGDNLSGIASAVVDVDGDTHPLAIDPQELGEAQVVLADGAYNWTVQVADAAGNAFETVAQSLTVDTTGPEYLSVSPPDGIAIAVATEFVLSFDEALSGITAVVASATLQTPFGELVTDASNLFLAFETTAAIFIENTPFDYSIVLEGYAVDGAGNAGTSFSFGYDADVVPPVLQLGVQSGAIVPFGQGSATIPGYAVDLFLEELTVNGVVIPVNPDGSFSYATPLQIGLNVFEFVATDQAGRSTSQLINIVRLDSNGGGTNFPEPELVFTEPMTIRTVNEDFSDDSYQQRWGVLADGGFSLQTGPTGLRLDSGFVDAGHPATDPVRAILATGRSYPQSFTFSVDAVLHDTTQGNYILGLFLGGGLQGDNLLAAEMIGAQDILSSPPPVTNDDEYFLLVLGIHDIGDVNAETRYIQIPYQSIANQPITFEVDYDLPSGRLRMAVPLFGFEADFEAKHFDRDIGVYMVAAIANGGGPPVRDSQLDFTISQIQSSLTIQTPAYKTSVSPLTYNNTLYANGLGATPAVIFWPDSGNPQDISSNNTPVYGPMGAANYNVALVSIGQSMKATILTDAAQQSLEAKLAQLGAIFTVDAFYQDYLIADGFGENYHHQEPGVEPDTYIQSFPANQVATGSASFVFNSNIPNAVFECQLDTRLSWSVCPASHSVNGLALGNHFLRVRAVDAAGNVDPLPAEVAWRYIDTIPAETTLVTTPDPQTQLAIAVFVAESDKAYEYRYTLDGELLEESTARIRIDNLEPGQHTLTAAAVNVDGVPDPTPEVFTWTILEDHGAPHTNIFDRPSELQEGLDYEFTFSATEYATYECQLDAGVWFDCSDGIVSGALDDYGQHTLTVRATDSQGNVEEYPETYTWTASSDELPPETRIIQAPATFTDSTTAVFRFVSDQEGTFECKIDGGSFRSCSSPYTVLGETQGRHVFYVRALDEHGNIDESPSFSEWVIGNRQIDTILTSSPPGVTTSRKAVFTFETNNEYFLSHYECLFGNVTTWRECASGVQFELDSDGMQEFSVRAVSLAGAADSIPEVYQWEIVDGIPEIHVLAGPSLETNVDVVGFFVESDRPAIVQCNLNRVGWVDCEGQPRFVDLEPGDYVMEFRAASHSAMNEYSDPISQHWSVKNNYYSADLSSYEVTAETVPEYSLELTWTGESNIATAKFSVGALSDRGHFSVYATSISGKEQFRAIIGNWMAAGERIDLAVPKPGVGVLTYYILAYSNAGVTEIVDAEMAIGTSYDAIKYGEDARAYFLERRKSGARVSQEGAPYAADSGELTDVRFSVFSVTAGETTGVTTERIDGMYYQDPVVALAQFSPGMGGGDKIGFQGKIGVPVGNSGEAFTDSGRPDAIVGGDQRFDSELEWANAPRYAGVSNIMFEVFDSSGTLICSGFTSSSGEFLCFSNLSNISGSEFTVAFRTKNNVLNVLDSAGSVHSIVSQRINCGSLVSGDICSLGMYFPGLTQLAGKPEVNGYLISNTEVFSAFSIFAAAQRGIEILPKKGTTRTKTRFLSGGVEIVYPATTIDCGKEKDVRGACYISLHDKLFFEESSVIGMYSHELRWIVFHEIGHLFHKRVTSPGGDTAGTDSSAQGHLSCNVSIGTYSDEIKRGGFMEGFANVIPYVIGGDKFRKFQRLPQDIENGYRSINLPNNSSVDPCAGVIPNSLEHLEMANASAIFDLLDGKRANDYTYHTGNYSDNYTVSFSELGRIMYDEKVFTWDRQRKLLIAERCESDSVLASISQSHRLPGAKLSAAENLIYCYVLNPLKAVERIGDFVEDATQGCSTSESTTADTLIFLLGNLLVVLWQLIRRHRYG